MPSFKIALATMAIVGPLATIAQAADMPSMPMPMPPPMQSARIDDLSGWYLRGDLGYRWHHVGGASTTAPFPNPGSNSLRSATAFGGGVGFKASWIRADLTLDYGLPARYRGSALAANDSTAKISSLTALINAYFDLGTWSGVTPYIGAGFGGANLRTTSWSSTGAPPFAGNGSASQWNFAWAAMAGVSYALTPSMAFDVGYRYLHLGDARTARDAFGRTTIEKIGAHELRAGVRWMFGGGFF